MTDKYKLVAEVGRGNHGAVYQAEHSDLSRPCALKLIPTTAITDRTLLLEEARRHASLPEHTNVVRVLDAGDMNDHEVYIASELCTGGTLEAFDGGKPIDPARACALISDLCRGLAHVHDHGLLHLDVRPANVLLADDGTPKLTDFGLARWIDDPTLDSFYLPHAAPELVESAEGVPGTDVYATAMTLAHLLTGGDICRPSLSGTALVQACCDGTWPRLNKLGPNVPKKLVRVTHQATLYGVGERTATIEDFKTQLDRATPATSFECTTSQRLDSTDGEWTIETTDHAGTHNVEVRRRDRRRRDLGGQGLTAAKARQTVAGLVTELAYPKKR